MLLKLILIHRYSRGFFLLVVFFLPGSFQYAQGQEFIVDDAGILTSQEEQRLALALRLYADSTSNQIAIRTLPSLQGQDIAEYATQMGQSLGVGQSDKDNGVLIVVSIQERSVFIAVGYGLEGAVPDALAGRIVRNIIVPDFRDGRYYAGLARAVDAIILAAAAGEYMADEFSVGRASRKTGDLGGLILFVMVLVFVISMMIRGGGGGGRRYRSDGMIPLMFLLGHASGRGYGGFGGGIGGGGFSGGFGGGGFGGGGAGGNW